jgi:hypothetical protein
MSAIIAGVPPEADPPMEEKPALPGLNFLNIELSPEERGDCFM